MMRPLARGLNSRLSDSPNFQSPLEGSELCRNEGLCLCSFKTERVAQVAADTDTVCPEAFLSLKKRLLAMRITPALVLSLSLTCLSAEAADDFRLVWADEFDYAGLPDSTRWGYDVGGHGWGNGELQYYTESRMENARVADGYLTIEAHKEIFEEKTYTSARLVTKGKGDWTYGRFEVRAKLPSGRGTWAAVWLLPTDNEYGEWPNSGEIDIMEHVGFDPDVVHSTVHTRAYYHSIGTQRGKHVTVPTDRSDFHTYVVEWTPQEVRGYVDDSQYFSFPNERPINPDANFRQWPFDERFHLILNIAIGGAWGGQKGVDPEIFPTQLVVDYVRVYELVGRAKVKEATSLD
jgi:beta-glucanase (GH16 family)